MVSLFVAFLRLSTPGIYAFNFADHRRVHGDQCNAASAAGAALGPSVLETGSRQRRRFRLLNLDSRSWRHRTDSVSFAEPQGVGVDGAVYRVRRAWHHSVLSPHARAQDPEN